MSFFKRKWFISAAAVVLTLGLLVGGAGAADQKDGLFQRLRTVYDVVEAWHKDGADVDKFVQGAIHGGLEALGDPYTDYFSPEEYQAFLQSLNGSFNGIGAYLELEGNYVVVSSPIKGSPAAAAGLMTGDRLLEANGTPLTGQTTEKAVQLIRGEPGTTVILKIERPSESRTFTVTITRSIITIPEVSSKMLADKVGYIELTTFGDRAAADFYKAVDELKAEGATSLVLDLRQNGGGYVNAAVEIASAFVPQGQPIMWTVGRDGKPEAENSTGRLINLPTTVLVDNGTASASEILAGAIQDYAVGKLVGIKTFGKGTVQTLLTLSAGGGMKVTTAEYLTAKQRHVHHIGLTPDYVVENPKPDRERTQPMEWKRFLSPTSVGLDVLYLQYRLHDLGYQTDVDGFFGILTTDAVVTFAKAHGLLEKPLVDSRFMEALNHAVTQNMEETAKTDVQLNKAVELVRSQGK